MDARMMRQMQNQVVQMQTRMAKMQEELAETIMTASAGGDAVVVEVTGQRELRSIKLKPEVVDPEDVETLEDLLLVAVNDALQKAEALAAQKMESVTGGMKIPGLM